MSHLQGEKTERGRHEGPGANFSAATCEDFMVQSFPQEFLLWPLLVRDQSQAGSNDLGAFLTLVNL